MFTLYNSEVMDYSGDMADKIGTGECGEILIYRTENGQTNIEVKIEDDTVWLNNSSLLNYINAVNQI